MELRHLTTFLAIVDSGTLTGAAKTLYKTQGAVSQDLKMLESELGVTLIDRSGQRVRLTPAGTALFPLASQVVHGVRKVEIEMSRVKRGEREVVRVGTLPSLALSVSRFLLYYRSSQPGLRFLLFTELQSTLMDWHAWLRPVTSTDEHLNRYDCPDPLVDYSPGRGEDGAHRARRRVFLSRNRFGPWCAARLAKP
jgi:hypothetical protein